MVRGWVPEELTSVFSDDEGQPLLNTSLLGSLLMDPLHSSPEVDGRWLLGQGPMPEHASLESGVRER